jgi:hypothetical protein
MIGNPMKIISVTAAAVWALTMLPLEAKADPQGLNIQSFRQHHHHRPFVQWPWYDYYNWTPYTYDDSLTYPAPETVVVKPDPPEVGCQHTEKTVTVPSANGGTTEVTVLRC